MANKNYISDELLAAYLEGNVNKEEMEQVLQAIENDAELREVLDIALRIEEEKDQPMLQIAAESGRNLCDVLCEAYVMKQRGMSPEEEKLLEIAKENHWIHKAGTPLQHMGNLMKHEGMKVDRRYNATTEDIKEALERGDGIIVAVDSDKLYPERPDEEDATNHAVVVTGMNSESVTIFDPGNIAEIDIPLQLFMSAWKESKYYIVCARPIIEKK